MKKINYLFLAISYWLLAVSYSANANPVTKSTAQTVASNYYSQNFKIASPTLTLVYTEYAKDGQADYYVFDLNTGGFVIVSAEDAAHPILSGGNEGKFVIPHTNNNFAWWMNCRKQEIEYARANHITAAANISNEWTAYITNDASKAPVVAPASTYLVKSTWDQSPYYNAYCPGGSVTGCVATAMAQIMKYWSYPSHGLGSHGYWDEEAYGYQDNDGYLSANFDTSNYTWSAMPLSISSTNNEVAKLMYDAGVSVDMDYDPSGSGAYVITGDDPICAQEAYVTNFGYDPETIQGLYKANYDTTNWRILIENEINHKRPVQYAGYDSVSPTNISGHTWVCDGYEGGTLPFHMNWGWSGYDDNWFALSALDGGGYLFNWWDEALIGIEPPAASPYFVATPTSGCEGMTVQYTDQSIVDSSLAITSRTWLFPGGTPNISTSLNPSVVYNSSGNFDVSEIITTAAGTDTLTRQLYVSVASAETPLPLAQAFQTAPFPPTGWANYNPNFYINTWQLCTFAGGFGTSSQCMMFNNSQGNGDYILGSPGTVPPDVIGQRQQIYTPEYDYTLTTNPKLYFDVAYAPYSNVFSDTLDVYYSTDCGSTWTIIYSKGGLTLGTTGGYVLSKADTNSLGCFLPTNSEWRTDTISTTSVYTNNISAIAGLSNVMFSFENRSGNGSAIYIDNINLPGVTVLGVANVVSSIPSVKVFPNPNGGQFTIGLTNVSGNPYVKIYNVLGQEVFTSQLGNGNTQLNLNQPNGVYIYRVFSETGSPISTGRLVVE